MKYQEVLNYLQKLTGKKEISQADIAKASGLTRSTVNYRKINNVEFSTNEFKKIKDYYENENQIWQNLYGSCQNNDQIQMLLYVDVKPSCGFGTVSNPNEYEQISVSRKAIKNYRFSNKYNAVIAYGDSMLPLIFENDILVVRECETIENHKIHIFSYDDEVFCKYLHKNVNELIIKSENSAYNQIVLKEKDMDKIKVWGVVEGIIRSV